jgi:hypothetical protein
LSYQLRRVIGTPVQHHRVDSEAAYVSYAKKFLLRLGVPPQMVRESAERPHAYVSGGSWVVKCPCGNAPSAHPGDGTPAWPQPVAVCLECGAVYRPVFPADREEAEAALLARPDPATRHYFPHRSQAAWVGEAKGQTAAYLRSENTARSRDIKRDRSRFPHHTDDEGSA